MMQSLISTSPHGICIVRMFTTLFSLVYNSLQNFAYTVPYVRFLKNTVSAVFETAKQDAPKRNGTVGLLEKFCSFPPRNSE